MFKYYSSDLAYRFINDYKLPISLVEPEIFEYYLNLYNTNQYNALDRYCKLVDLIETKFNGEYNKFLDEYYSVRDNAIRYIEDSDAYKEFINMDMNKFGVKSDIRGGDIYSEDNIGKYFLSIDLKMANFQALKYANVLTDDTYDAFMSRFTDIDYIKDSKYIRQVIFGHCNAKRQITIEKYLMNCILDVIKDIMPQYNAELVRFNNDELIFNIPKSMFDITLFDGLRSYINAKLPNIIVSIEVFELRGYQLKSLNDGSLKPMFYQKVYDIYGTKTKLMKVPQLYAAIVNNLIHNGKTDKADYYFKYENIRCIIDGEYILK